jgi:lipid II:glycine glycyltransferase (peptidoglycan interpeptide bridge formation enzyme)
MRSEQHSPPVLAVIAPERAAWQAFVDAHPQGNLLQGAAWSELKARFGWQPRRIAISDATGGIVAGAQLLFRHRYGLSVAYIPRGPLFSGAAAADRALLQAITRLARYQRAVLVRLEPNRLETSPQANGFHSWMLLQRARPAATIQPRSSIHVDLQRSEDAIFAAFSKGHRADIRRAERQGMHVRVGTAADVPTFHAIMTATGARAAFGVHSSDYYQSVWELHRPRACLLLAELNGAPVAAQLVCADAQSGAYLYSGALADGLRSGANHLLSWHAIRWARDLGCRTYDLWGVPDAFGQAAAAETPAERAALEAAAQSDPLIGVYRFKKGFGGMVVRFLPAYDLPLIPPLYRLAVRRIDA